MNKETSQKKNLIRELETSIVDQIEKLNDDSIGTTPEETQAMCERSKQIANLANS